MSDEVWGDQMHFNGLTDTKHGPMLYNRQDLYVGRSLVTYGEYSEGEVALFERLITRAMVVVEVGANIGALTVPLARLARGVLAYEPQRLAFQLLCGNVALNSLPNVWAQPFAIGKAAGTIRVPMLDPLKTQNFGGLDLRDQPLGEVVPCVPLDGLGLPQIDFLKADVEGMELDVLEGGLDTLRRCRPMLYLECDRADRREALLAFLAAQGYRAYWHRPPLFRPDNFRGVAENIFTDDDLPVLSFNLLCLRPEHTVNVRGLEDAMVTLEAV